MPALASTDSARKSWLSAQDLVNVGVFTAIYFVLLFGLGMLGLLGPAIMLVGHSLAILANGIVIAIYLSRVPRVGALTLMGAISALLMTLTGHSWYGLVGTPILGFIADLVANTGRFRKPMLNTLAYGIFTLWGIFPMLPLVIDSVGYRENLAENMGEQYADAFVNLFTVPVVIICGFGSFVLALIGGIFGQSVLRRHFKRAGLA